MSYKPNFTDKRTLKRIRSAYGFTKGALSTTTPHNWAQVVIDKHIGRSNNNLGNYLRNLLLICTNNHYDSQTGVTKQYIANQQGLDYLRDILYGSNTTQFTQWVQNNGISKNIISLTTTTPSMLLLFDHYCVNKFIEEEYELELQNLDFDYTDKSNRLWHPIQNIKKDYKKSIFATHKLNYQYDIDTCAPTLLHQYSHKLDMDIYLFALRTYLKDKQMIRTQLAKELDVSPKVIKIIINALFCGARIGSGDFAISKLLDNDIAKIQWLKQNSYITELRNDIKLMWSYIEPSMAKTTKITKSGLERKVALSSKKKWQLYFELERQVLNQVQNYLRLTKNRYFLEHDGWATEHQINEHELSQYIKDSLGFDVKFKMEHLENIKSLTTTTPSMLLLYGNLENDIKELKKVIK
tara:strand:+ start:531 stop:1757 length:1227 start_codon:yes stop_codon:yes gene_type:complete